MTLYLVHEESKFSADNAANVTALSIVLNRVAGHYNEFVYQHDKKRGVHQYFIKTESDLPKSVLEKIAKEGPNGIGMDIKMVEN